MLVVVTLLAALVLAVAIVWSTGRIVGAMSRRRGVDDRALEILGIFAPAAASGARDPKALLAWQPLAAATRRLFPEELAALDRASGGTFPFSKEQFQAAHAHWTAEWLAWERTHDTEYKLRAVVLRHEIETSGGSIEARAKLEMVEAEKLETYQRRYEEYIRVAKAIQALIGT